MDTKDSDRELLKWAAKAAGYEVVSDALASSYGGGKPTLYLSHNGPSWNPLTDDGDALRLAVKLNMLAGIGECDCCAEAHYQGGEEPVRVRFSSDFPDCEASDAFSATRRAIVRAAAEIGRNMP